MFSADPVWKDHVLFELGTLLKSEECYSRKVSYITREAASPLEWVDNRVFFGYARRRVKTGIWGCWLVGGWLFGGYVHG